MGVIKGKSKPSATPLSQRPAVLRAASIERIDEAAALLDRESWALSMYSAGVAVECLLQAFAFRDGAAHDAKHDLARWLAKCPLSLSNAILARAAPDWSALN